jgi:two-component system chemotaxis response regulator CheB
MPVPRLVVVGASSGGIETLRTLVGGLPPDFAAPLCVVLHTSPQSPGMLDVILNRAGVLPAITPTDQERLQPGRIYVAPPDRHLLVEPGLLRITRGPKENRFRPAIDPLFRSAAQVYGPAVIGVVLSGSLDDGTAGLRVIKQLTPVRT